MVRHWNNKDSISSVMRIVVEMEGMMDFYEPACFYEDYPHPCPHCGRIVYFELIDDCLYCPECGQEISEDEDEDEDEDERGKQNVKNEENPRKLCYNQVTSSITFLLSYDSPAVL